MNSLILRYLTVILLAMPGISQAADQVSRRSYPNPKDEASRSNLGYKVVGHYPSTFMGATTADRMSGLIAAARINESPMFMRLSNSTGNIQLTQPPSEGYFNGGAWDMLFNEAGNRLFVGDRCLSMNRGCGGIEILNTQDPTHIYSQATYEGSSITAIALSKDETKLFFGDEWEVALVILDVTNANQPVRLGKLKTKDKVRSIFALNSKIVFFTTFDGGLYVVDIAKPRHPKVIGTLAISQAESIVVSSNGRTAFVSSHSGIIAVDLANLRHPKPIGSYSTDVTSNAPLYLRAKNSHLYVMTPDQGLVVLDVTIPERMSQVGILHVPNPSQTDRFFVSDDEQMIYLSTIVYDGEDTENVGGLTIFQRKP